MDTCIKNACRDDIVQPRNNKINERREFYMKIDSNTPAEKMTIAGNIYEAGNSLEFKTGDWRSVAPKFISEKCKQCGLCFPVCPDDAIPVNKDGMREDFNYDFCKGCGVCAKVCPFGAIEME